MEIKLRKYEKKNTREVTELWSQIEHVRVEQLKIEKRINFILQRYGLLDSTNSVVMAT